MLKLNQSNEELNRTKNELFETKEKLNKAGDNINEKTKYIDKLKGMQEKHDYQNNKVKELEGELNEKYKHIVALENKNCNIIAKSNKAHNQEIEKLKKERKTSDDKVFDVLNKFKNNIESKMSDLDKMVTSKENKWNPKLNELNNNVKKLDNYIKENNNEKINKEKELDTVNNEYNKLLLKLNQSNKELNRTRN